FLQGRTLQDAITAYHSSDGADVSKEVQQLRLLESFLTVCQTVAYAHSRGVIHRDLKPDNIIVGEYGETLLLDWGLAKVMGQPEAPSGGDDGNGLASYSFVRLSVTGESTQTRAGAVKGTPGYMAPETASGNIEAVDQASDIYLLGATLYHVLTGQPPRQGKNLSQLLTQARKEPPPPPRSVKPGIPKPLEAICLKAMAFQKQDRYASASALAEDLQRYLAGEPVAAYRETLLERTWRWCRRHRQRLGWCAAAFLVVATALFGWLKLPEVQRQHDQERREAALELRQKREA